LLDRTQADAGLNNEDASPHLDRNAVADDGAPYPPFAGGDAVPDASAGPRRATGLLDQPGLGGRVRRALPALASPALTSRGPALPPPVELIAPGYVPPAPAAAGPLDAGPAAPRPAASDPADESSEPRTTSPAELDRLARDLYGRVQSQLRSELLVGRERAQRLTDIG